MEIRSGTNPVNVFPTLLPCPALCRYWLVFGISCLSAIPWSAAQPVTYTPVHTHVDAKEGTVTLENEFLQLIFEPARGGRCKHFLFKDTGEQIIASEDLSGMFLDHWAKYSWPSGLMHLPYHFELVKDGDNKSGVRLWIEVPKTGGGKGERSAAASRQIQTSPELVGLVVQKTIWLRTDNDVVEVEQETINPTAESRAAALYIQQNLGMGGSYHSDNWYLPSGRGIEVYFQAAEAGGQSFGPDFISDPVDGWIAVRDRSSERGLLFVFDYNYLQQTYTSGGTGEWFMEQVPIGPGRSFQTRYLVKPTAKLENFVYGSRRLVADLHADEMADDQVQVTHDLEAVYTTAKQAHVEIQVTGWVSKEKIAQETYEIGNLGYIRHRQQFSFPAEKLTDGVVISAIVRSGPNEDRYEFYYAGDQAEEERRSISFATKGRAVASNRGDAYFRAQPRKHKNFDKPDFAEVPRPAKDRYRCLVVYGLYTHILNLDDAVSDRDRQGKIPVEFNWANCPPNAVETFPGTYNELFQYDLIVLSDVNAAALGDIAIEMLCDYVHEGGSLLVVGGPYAYGNGEFDGSRFLQVLPVHLSGPFDLKWAGKGMSWPLERKQADHPLLAGISFTQNPRVFWHHFLTPKQDARVVLTAGKQPACVVGRYGKGKVAALSLSPTGVGLAGEIAWWDWDGWFPLVNNLFTWAKDSK